MADDSDEFGRSPVGYGRPPKHTQFKKGQSGNPSGRPKGSKNMLTLMREELAKEVLLPVNGKMRRHSEGEIAAMMWAKQLMQGDHRARDQYLKLEERALAAEQANTEEVDETIEVYMDFDNEERCPNCGRTFGPGLMAAHQCQGPGSI